MESPVIKTKLEKFVEISNEIESYDYQSDFINNLDELVYEEKTIRLDYDSSVKLFRAFRNVGLRLANADKQIISYYASKEHALKYRRTEIKFGRFLRQFTDFSDPQIESLVNAFKLAYAPKEYELIIGKEREDFKYAYTTKAVSKSVFTQYDMSGFDVKCLSASCMRYDFNGQAHPSEVYASGDFEILYAKLKGQDIIGARVVISNRTASNIYSDCDFATNLIVDKLDELAITPDLDFTGLRLLKIKTDERNYYVMPYIDGYDFVGEHDEEHFEIVNRRDDSVGHCNSTSGRTYVKPLIKCHDCGELTTRSREIDTEQGEIEICEDCLSEYVFSHVQGVRIPRGDSFYDTGLESYVSTTYLQLQMAYQTIETVTRDWAVIPEENYSRRLTPALTFIVNEERILRDNYQLNEIGIPERLPELPGIHW